MENTSVGKQITIRRVGKLCLLILLIIIGPSSCQLFNGCPDYKPHFLINGIYLYNLKFTGAALNPWETIAEDETVEWDKFFMQVAFDVTYITDSRNVGTFSLYATSCDENGERGAKVGIDTLYLTTLFNYNNTYSQNDTLNDIILANDFTFTRHADDFYNFYPLTQYVNENSNAIKRSLFELRISEAPFDGESEQQFKLIYILDNGETFEQTTDVVKLVY